MRASGLRSIVCAAVVAAVVALLIAAGSSCRGTSKPEPQAATSSTPAKPADENARTPLFPVDVGTPDPLVQRLCDALHTLPEARKAECCAIPPGSSLAAECVRTLTASVRDRAIVLDARKVEQCVQGASAAYASCDWVKPLAPAAPAACIDVLEGQLKAGAQCRSSLECADGLSCKGVRPTTPGVCAPPGATGTLCAGSPDTLAIQVKDARYQADHPECQGFCRGGRCAEPIAAGGACSSDVQCGTGLRCDAGRCSSKPLSKLGESCSGNACEPGARCADGRCVPFKKAGEVCTSPFECSASCVAAPGATTGICGPQCVASPGGLPLVPPRRRGD
jgi:hypothetical protein